MDLVRFDSPELFPVLGVIPAAWVFYTLVCRQRRRSRERFAQSALGDFLLSGASKARFHLRFVCLLVATSLLVLTLPGPQWKGAPKPVEPEGLDVVLCLDVSRSMLAQDESPNRLERAKREISGLLRELEREGVHRAALVTFAGAARLEIPLSRDFAWFRRTLLEQIVNPPALRGGSSLANALVACAKTFSEAPAARQIFLLVSDGEDLLGHIGKALPRVKEAGLTFSCLGVGTAQGATIPITDREGNRTVVQDQSGQIVFSRLSEVTLLSIANVTGGKYRPAGQEEGQLIALFRETRLEIERKKQAAPEVRQYEPIFYWTILCAALLLVAELAIFERSGKTQAVVRQRAFVTNP